MRYFSLLLFLFFASDLSAQQDARYSQYMFNGLVLNPAYAGNNDNANFTAFYRNQWIDIPGAPKTISISAHSPFGQKKKVGLGLFLENDTVGPNSVLDVFTSYSYKLPLATGTLVAGIQLGGIYVQSDLTNIVLGNPEFDQAFVSESSFKPNFGVGLYYYSDKWYAGFSAPHLINYKNDLTSTFTRFELNYFATAGMAFDVSPTMMFKPSLLLKYQPTSAFFAIEDENDARLQADISVALWYLESLWFGATYRTDSGLSPESMVMLFSYHFANGLRFGYAFDLNLNAVRTYQNGTHEIMFGYALDLHKADTYMSPRYF